MARAPGDSSSISIAPPPPPPPSLYHHDNHDQTNAAAAIPVKGKGAKTPKAWFMPRHDSPSPTHFQKIVAEVVGTYMLVFMGCASALTDRVQPLTIVGVALVWGFVLMAAIYAVGPISGAHFNPAVTVALAAVRRFPWREVPMYVVAQLLGATLGSLTLRGLFHKQPDIHPIMTQYKASTSDLEAFTWEFIITFTLMFSIFANATDHRCSKGLAGFAIGSTLLVNVMVAGPITGASMNPARSIGPAIASGVYDNLWLYIVAPLLGALFAAVVYTGLRAPEPAVDQKTADSI